MPMNVNRWLKYAKAKLDDSLASGNKELDELEARQKADRTERPWLASEGDAPTFDEARARIAWQAQEAEAAERSSAQIILDQRAEESAARLAQIRAELGVDDPAPPPG